MSRHIDDRQAHSGRGQRGAQKAAIVILGVHRSGTSAITRVLSLLGARLPRNLMPPSRQINARGFWESPEVMSLNDEALRSAGSGWDQIRPPERKWFKSQEADRLRDRIGEVLREQFGDASLFVLKDPRLCYLMPLWGRALKKFGARPHIIHIFRHPSEVVASLHTAQRLSSNRSRLLWLRYTVTAEQDTRRWTRAFLSFDHFLCDWTSALQHLSSQLRIEWPRTSEATRADVQQFLSRGLRHHARRESRRQSVLEAHMMTAYGALSALAEYPHQASSEVHARLTLDELGRQLALLDIACSLSKPVAGKTQSSELALGLELRELERLRSENEALARDNLLLRKHLSYRDFDLSRWQHELRSQQHKIEQLDKNFERTRERMAAVVQRLCDINLRPVGESD